MESLVTCNFSLIVSGKVYTNDILFKKYSFIKPGYNPGKIKTAQVNPITLRT